MITFLFLVFLFGILGRLLCFICKATWSIMKMVMFMLILPLVVVMILDGLIHLALPLLVAVGIIGLLRHA